jgi:hypothetical protein
MSYDTTERYLKKWSSSENLNFNPIVLLTQDQIYEKITTL